MRINLADIARGRRIVAIAARDLNLIRHSERPARKGILSRLLALFRAR